MNYLLDTTAYSELLRGHKKVGEIVRNADELYVPSVVIAELEYGFRLGTRQLENEKLLARFVSNRKVHILLPDNATTSYFVDIAVFAHKKGVQLSSHDMWIAALAEQWNVVLVSFDKDFEHLTYKDLQLWADN